MLGKYKFCKNAGPQCSSCIGFNKAKKNKFKLMLISIEMVLALATGEMVWKAIFNHIKAFMTNATVLIALNQKLAGTDQGITALKDRLDVVVSQK